MHASRPAASRKGQFTIGAVAASVIASSAFAGGSQTWPFDLTTTGNPVSFTSPTAVSTTADEYVGTFHITHVIVTGTVGILTIGPVDETSMIDPALLTGTGTVAGPAPVTIFSDSIVAPPPPQPVAISANVTLAINAGGFGTLSATNVVLGNFTTTIPPFGMVTIHLTSVRIQGTVTVDPNDLASPADLNHDGLVNSLDLGILLSAWSIPSKFPGCGGAVPCASDLNGDGLVNTLDLGILLASWTL